MFVIDKDTHSFQTQLWSVKYFCCNISTTGSSARHCWISGLPHNYTCCLLLTKTPTAFRHSFRRNICTTGSSARHWASLHAHDKPPPAIKTRTSRSVGKPRHMIVIAFVCLFVTGAWNMLHLILKFVGTFPYHQSYLHA